MYRIVKSIDIDFAHHVSGHKGACINVHGHTWKFEVAMKAKELNPVGFVIDFGDLKRHVLQPVHDFLDHSMALGEDRVMETFSQWEAIGQKLLATRAILPHTDAVGSKVQFLEPPEPALCGARRMLPGGIKLAVFPFNPTSERLAKWLFDVATAGLRRMSTESSQVSVSSTTIYETLHPVIAAASYMSEE